MPIITYLTSYNYTEYTNTTGDLTDWQFGDYKGQVLINQVAGEDILFGALCYRKSNTKWLLANPTVSNAASTSMLGICVQDASTGSDTKILTSGYVSEQDGSWLDWGDIGTPVFMSASFVNMSYLAPSSAGNVVRIVGSLFWNFDNHPNSINIIYFNPDNTWIELT